MKLTPHIQTIVIGLALMLFGGEIVKAEMPPLEPEEAYLVDEDINIVTGLYTREYSLHQDGVVDYKTARQIIISEYNEYWNSVLETKEFPLFYWHDGKRGGTEIICNPRGYGGTYQERTGFNDSLIIEVGE